MEGTKLMKINLARKLIEPIQIFDIPYDGVQIIFWKVRNYFFNKNITC